MLELEFEKNLFTQGSSLIAGIDEAGRGPLAGPVVAACVIIDKDFVLNNEELKMITDSKDLTSKKRELLFKVIKDNVKAIEIGVVDPDIIDKINILQASFLAMRRALKKVGLNPDHLIVDGNFKIPKIKTPQTAVIQGDKNVWTVAAASIIAKVSRDWIMANMDEKYPQYGFIDNKGYGTKKHLTCIKEHGPCLIHRRSFAPIKNYKLKIS